MKMKKQTIICYGEMSEAETKSAKQQLEKDNYFLDKYKYTKLKGNVLKQQLKLDLQTSTQYKDLKGTELDQATERIYKKIMIVNREYLSISLTIQESFQR